MATATAQAKEDRLDKAAKKGEGNGKAKDAARSRKAARSSAPGDARVPGSAKAPKGAAHNKELGRRGEDAAARFLAQRGYEILERNWECPAGEADIIAQDEGGLVFVEVKTRSDASMGFPAEAVTAKKRERYEKIACMYAQDHDVADAAVRFDVVSLVVVAPDRAMVRHHINAWAEAR